MNFTNIPQEELSSYFANINTYLESNFEIQWTKYLDLGVKKVRLISYSKEFLAHVEKHMGYVLCDSLDSYGATIVLWEEKDIESFINMLSDKFNPKNNIKLRVELLALRRTQVNSIIASKNEKVDGDADVRIRIDGHIIEARDERANTYYYALDGMTSKDVAMQGHLFVQAFTHILRDENTGMVHSAVVGLNNKGMLFCGRSGKGKSTLSVAAMMAGFEYVSDDYLTIEREGDKIYTYPIYSMISLSHAMYDNLYTKMKGKFMYNNTPGLKYIFNINAYHDQFRKKYPIELCLFPQIVDDEEPSVVPCAKTLPMFQFVHSSLEQVLLVNDKKSLKRFYEMIKDLNYYQINLCQDLDKNVACLRSFIENYDPSIKNTFEEEDIVVDFYNETGFFFDIQNLIFYSMNQFTTNIFQNFQNNVSVKTLVERLNTYSYIPKGKKELLEDELSNILAILQERNLLKNYKESNSLAEINEVYLIRDKAHFYLAIHEENKSNNLLTKV